MVICVNPCVRKRGFSVKALQVLEACTHSQREKKNFPMPSPTKRACENDGHESGPDPDSDSDSDEGEEEEDDEDAMDLQPTEHVTMTQAIGDENTPTTRKERKKAKGKEAAPATTSSDRRPGAANTNTPPTTRGWETATRKEKKQNPVQPKLIPTIYRQAEREVKCHLASSNDPAHLKIHMERTLGGTPDHGPHRPPPR